MATAIGPIAATVGPISFAAEAVKKHPWNPMNPHDSATPDVFPEQNMPIKHIL